METETRVRVRRCRYCPEPADRAVRMSGDLMREAPTDRLAWVCAEHVECVL